MDSALEFPSHQIFNERIHTQFVSGGGKCSSKTATSSWPHSADFPSLDSEGLLSRLQNYSPLH